MSRCLLLLATSVIAVMVAPVGAAAIEINVQTTLGPIRGFFDDAFNITSFVGIPYGTVDERFKKPKPHESWTDTFEARNFTKVCPQISNNEVIGVEDCLVLNVFVPAEAVNLPVLFHIHGGEFQYGSANPEVYGPQRLVQRGIVLVVPNYRLGPLGFLCLRNKLAPGNAGLKDLELAIHWVYENIGAFGGNSEAITVSGEGYGGVAAGFLAISPNTNKVFKRVITDSGSTLSPLVLDRDPVNQGLNMAASLQSNFRDDDEVDLNVLLQVDINVLVNAASHGGYNFRPCVEDPTNNTDAFLTLSPYQMMRRETNATISLMIGCANSAGMHNAAEQTNVSMANIESNNYSSLLPADLSFQSTTSRSTTAQRIKVQYFGDDPVTFDKLHQYMEYYTDATFMGPAVRVARLFAEHGSPVYFYEFGYEGALNRAKELIDSTLPGAAVGDIIGYVFVQGHQLPEMTAEDEQMATLMTDLWSNFIKTGAPAVSSEQLDVNVEWSSLTSEKEYMLKITTAVQLVEGVHAERVALWDELYATHYIDCTNSAAIVDIWRLLLIFVLGFYKLTNSALLY